MSEPSPAPAAPQPVRPVRKAVVTAAGRGTRQYPASSAVQKEMFPLVDRDGLSKPVLQIIGEEAVAAGVEEICIVTGPGDEHVYRDYFQRMNQDDLRAFRGKDWAILQSEKLQEFGERLTFVPQQSPEGYGHAVYQAREFVGDEPFLLMLGDHIYISADRGGANCAKQLIDRYHAAGRQVMTAVQMTPGKLLHLFGTLQCELLDPLQGLYQVDAIYEKPTEEYAAAHLRTSGLPPGSYLCHFGLHVFPAAIFDALEYHLANNLREKGEFQLTNAQEYLRAKLLAPGEYAACTIDGQRFDTGIPYGVMESQIALALAGVHRAEIVEAIARLLAEQLQSVSKR